MKKFVFSLIFASLLLGCISSTPEVQAGPIYGPQWDLFKGVIKTPELASKFTKYANQDGAIYAEIYELYDQQIGGIRVEKTTVMKITKDGDFTIYTTDPWSVRLYEDNNFDGTVDRVVINSVGRPATNHDQLEYNKLMNSVFIKTDTQGLW